MWNAECGLLVAGCWLLVAGCWLDDMLTGWFEIIKVYKDKILKRTSQIKTKLGFM